MRRIWRLLMTDLSRGKTSRSRRQRGAALIFVTFAIAIMGIITISHLHNSQVDLASAQNTRDELKAEYIARSALNLTRLLLKVQERAIDPHRATIAGFLQRDLQVKDLVPVLMPLFFGETGLLEAVGIDLSGAAGLGFPKTYGQATMPFPHFASEDGKLNVNCAHVRTEQDPQVLALFGGLYALFANPRYRELFENLDEIDDPDRPAALARAIIDYIDQDTSRFQGGGAAEDYRYEDYKAKDNVIDSLDELHLVRGVNDVVWANFAPSLTIYGSCVPNLCAVDQGNWLMAAAVIARSAKDPSSPVLLDPISLYRASVSALMTLQMFGCTDLNLFAQGAQNPAALMQMAGVPGQGGTPGQPGAAAQIPGIELDTTKLQQAAYIGPRRIYKIVVEGTAGWTGRRDKLNNPIWRVRRRITAVWDQQAFSSVTGKRGMYVYWRMD